MTFWLNEIDGTLTHVPVDTPAKEQLNVPVYVEKSNTSLSSSFTEPISLICVILFAAAVESFVVDQ